jgi:hypothetical protein
MELLIAFIIMIVLLGMLNWAAIHWGYDSRTHHISDSYLERRSNW